MEGERRAERERREHLIATRAQEIDRVLLLEKVLGMMMKGEEIDTTTAEGTTTEIVEDLLLIDSDQDLALHNPIVARLLPHAAMSVLHPVLPTIQITIVIQLVHHTLMARILPTHKSLPLLIVDPPLLPSWQFQPKRKQRSKQPLWPD